MQNQEPVTETSEFEVKPQAPRLRSRMLLLAVLGLAVVIVVGIAAGAILNRTAAPADDPLAKLMPADAVMYFSMTTHPEEQPNYNVIADAWKDSPEAKQIQAGLKMAIAFTGFDWADDIQPWLGERVAIGVVDLGGYSQSTDAQGGQKATPAYRAPFIVVAAQTRDRAKSDAFLAAVREQRASGLSTGKIVDETYRGIPIVYVADDSEYTPVAEAYATVNDVVVLTFGADNLKKVIDAALDGAGLADQDQFAKTMGALTAENVGAFYMDYGRYLDLIFEMERQTSAVFDNITSSLGESNEALANQMKEEQLRQEKQREQLRQMMAGFGGVGAVMTYEPSGIRFDTAMQFDLSQMPETWRDIYSANLSAASGRVFDAIPASAVAAMNANEPFSAWGAMLDDPAFWSFWPSDVGGKSVPDLIAEFERQVGIDLKADVFDQLNGEVAFVMLPKARAEQSRTDSYFGSLPFEFAVMADSSDAARVTASLDRLVNALIERKGGASLQPLGSLQATAVLDRNGDVMLAYGVVDGRVVIGSSADTLRAIDAADQSPLSADATFKNAVSPLSPDRLSTVYVQFEPLWQWLESTSGQFPQECATCAYLKPIRWLSADGEAPDTAGGLIHSTMHIGVAP